MSAKGAITLLAILAIIVVSSTTVSVHGTLVDVEISTGSSLLAWTSDSWIRTTQGHFDAGVLGDVDTSTTPGDVVLTAPETTPTGTLASQVLDTLVPWPSWYDAQWAYRKSITIDHTKVDADLADFPVLISLTDADLKDNGNGGHLGQPDGGDILFTRSDGVTKLDHEIEGYTPSTGELVAWVEVNTVSSVTDTVIYLYYGNAGCADQWNTSGTWNAAFLMVQHLEESPNDGVAGCLDSTVNGFNFIPVNFQDGGGGSTNAVGKIGGADFFAGDDDYLMESGFDSVYWEDYYAASWTWSAWIKTAVNSTLYTEGRDSFVAFDTIQLTSSGQLHSRGHDDNWNSSHTFNSVQKGLNNNTWRHVAFSNIDGHVDIYIDGKLDSSQDYALIGGARNITKSTIGAFRRLDPPNGFWNGYVDEVQISSTNRSAAWIKASYRNQNFPASFYRIGSEEHKDGLFASRWDALFWEETLAADTDITFEVRASDTVFLKDAVAPAWSAIGGTSPVMTGLPGGRYMQWRATLTTTNPANTPTLHEVRAYYY